MKKVILVKNGEIVLKGLNRSTFEDILIKNIRRRLAPAGTFTFHKSQSTITVIPDDDNIDFDLAIECMKHVFGIVGFSVAAVCEKDIEAIKQTALEFLGDDLRAVRTFKVNGKRSDKRFAMTSPEICREVGAHILSNIQPLKVDVHAPELTVTVEVRDQVLVHGNQWKGAGGLPVGSSGKACLLLSGGIDSPVAGWMMAKRGMILEAVHFASPPYTSRRAEEKVKDLAAIVARYSGRIHLMVVPFTKIQETIKDNCPEDMFTLIMRRLMMKIALRLAEERECKALITGESLGQVASQTVDALACTDAVATKLVLRPLIGMDKDEIIEIARKIDSFETSLLPYEDCCTVFTPKHPKTRPVLSMIEEAEAAVDFDTLIDDAVRRTAHYNIDA
ncbi:MAG: tRNA 4-thiouridine(8) synthase ThiI [Clostridia bacterium]|nr:tRNA 4-thiouridine(8) synthase ThiI [Clostridia bacterium]